MAKIAAETIEQYKKILTRDPSSKVFAPLAEALRENGFLAQAERIATDGIKRHPDFVGGFVALGRILLDQQRRKEAVAILQRATEMDPENLLALQLLGKVYLDLQMTKEALKVFKMVLFLNPLSEKAKRAVEKLESFSADEYEEDIFQYKTLPAKNGLQGHPEAEENLEEIALPPTSNEELERKLSLVDALIIRNDVGRAKEALTELSLRYPGNNEITRRFGLFDESAPEEESEEIQPLLSRENLVIERKRSLLENLLQRIKEHQGPSAIENFPKN
ncbi:MAG: hypothetical protein COT73_09015 [Bdellovibrio sp. CG10_big_fil_rev_8_21_14_0_10_47_8]|nr:MAG: hypothetical protein COT73_09015 [Bdellovibrio sp. CG10_big_fil_rev_8_21_14_0_10_47_8]